ncbi:MAG: hypothetical protein R3E90_14705 [Marinicella sp.]
MMLAFFKHKKFWLPIVYLLLFFSITEILLRLGLYDKWIKPNSFLGNGIYRERAIKKSGLDQIQWISIGNSRFDWGVNQQKLTKELNKIGINYKKMSFESSNFISIQATIGWSIENMKNLEGIILGVSDNELSKLQSFSNQYKIAWPFREHITVKNYQSISESFLLFKYYYSLAWVNYFPDIKSILRNPIKRMDLINQAKNKNVLTESHHNQKDLCEHDVSTLDQCVTFAQNKRLKTTNSNGYNLLKSLCSKPLAVTRNQNGNPMPATPHKDELIENWTELFNLITNQNLQLILVLMPEHEANEYILNPSNSSEIRQAIINNFNNNSHFKVLDLRNVFTNDASCKYFSDPLHFNNKGVNLFTKQLINDLVKSI